MSLKCLFVVLAIQYVIGNENSRPTRDVHDEPDSYFPEMEFPVNIVEASKPFYYTPSGSEIFDKPEMKYNKVQTNYFKESMIGKSQGNKKQSSPTLEKEISSNANVSEGTDSVEQFVKEDSVEETEIKEVVGYNEDVGQVGVDKKDDATDIKEEIDIQTSDIESNAENISEPKSGEENAAKPEEAEADSLIQVDDEIPGAETYNFTNSPSDDNDEPKSNGTSEDLSELVN